MAKTMWKFKTHNFTIAWDIEKDVLNTDYWDAELASETRKMVKSGKMKCFMSTIRVSENSTELTLSEAYLGGSVYANPEDFRDHFGCRSGGYGSYFSDMVREAIRDARRALLAHQERTRKEVASKQKLLKIKLRAKQPAMA